MIKHLSVDLIDIINVIISYINQMVFADKGEIISGGNFHGEYPAKVNNIY